MAATKRQEFVPSERFGALLAETHFLFIRDMLTRAHRAGFTNTQSSHLNIMRRLTERGARISEIAADSGVSKQATSRVVMELIEKGFVSIEPDPTDKRAKIVRTTPLGGELQKMGTQTIEEVRQEYAEIMGEKNMVALIKLLKKLHEAQRQLRSKSDR